MTTIELAPNHKVGLPLANPVMPAAGCFGLGSEYGPLVDVETLGAVVVGPVTAGPRRGAEPPRTLPVPGGVLLHTGLANPGIVSVLRRHAHGWAHAHVPVIVHVGGTTPEETASCCRRLATVETVAGIELGLPDNIHRSADPYDMIADAAAIIGAARAAAGQPLIVRLPMRWADTLCEAAVEGGADALTVAAPPRGTARHRPSGHWVTGRLYGPFVLPLALHTLRRVAERVSVPLIGCGGIHSPADARIFLHAGAIAIQIDAAIWHDPACLARIARNLSPAAELR